MVHYETAAELTPLAVSLLIIPLPRSFKNFIESSFSSGMVSCPEERIRTKFSRVATLFGLLEAKSAQSMWF